MNDVKFPIETYRKGDKITKICVEDISKMLRKIDKIIDISTDKIKDMFFNVDKYYKGNYGKYIIGTGRATPSLTDSFDEEIGNNIAFMKAKLNANIKKHNILAKAYNEMYKSLKAIDDELSKIDRYIHLDLEGIRRHNPEYLEGIEEKLGV